MVKGNKRFSNEVDPILDDIVTESILYIKENCGEVIDYRPQFRDYEKFIESGLTKKLIESELINEGYVAVICGTQTKLDEDFDGGYFNLVIYAHEGKRSWEKQGSINVDLDIELSNDKKGLENSVCSYSVEGKREVVMEDANCTTEGWDGAKREVLLFKDVVVENVVKEDNIHVKLKNDDVLAYHPDKEPVDQNGLPIAESLFNVARARYLSDEHPKGTRYEVDKANNQILCYFPKSE